MKEKNIDIIILNFLHGRINSEDLSELNRWIEESKEHHDYFEHLKKVWMLTSIHNTSDPNKELAYGRFLKIVSSKQEKINKSKRFNIRRILPYAASILAVLALSVISAYFYWGSPSTPLVTLLEVPRGSKLYITLPDSSIAWINAGSKIKYTSDFAENNRNLELDGEGYFEVKKGKTPFIVKTGDIDVKVLGTKFNVRNYKEDQAIKVALLEGSVVVNNKDNEFLLKESQTVMFDKEKNNFELANTKVKYSNEWIKGNLFFDEESFAYIAIELERAFNINIHFESEELKKLIFYGNFVVESNNLENILDIMSATKKFNYSYNIVNNDVYIYNNK